MKAPLKTFIFAAFLAASAAHAQQSTEDRMRDALRQAVTEMRAAQDQSAQAQADLAKAQAEKAALQSQLDAATAKLAAQPATPAPRPAEDAVLQSKLQAAEAQAAQYQQLTAKLQSSYQQAAEQARAKSEESQQAAAGLKAKAAALESCKTANTKLMEVAEQVLHLYETQSFRAVLLKSYEPILGQARVKLENMVQDYDDKIRDQEYVPTPPRPH